MSALPHVKLEGYPRMADFAVWATACERAGTDALWDIGLFADAYAMNRASATQSVIEEDLVADGHPQTYGARERRHMGR